MTRMHKNQIISMGKESFSRKVLSKYGQLQKALYKRYKKKFISQIIHLLSIGDISKIKKKNVITSFSNHYDLEEIYQELNNKYFSQKIKVPIVWFGNTQREAQVSRVLGYYDENMNIIKIHRLLDSPNFPLFYFRYVVYHEMLHTVCRPYVRYGRYITHHKKFRMKEKEFQEYALAIEWEKKNINTFFSDQKKEKSWLGIVSQSLALLCHGSC